MDSYYTEQTVELTKLQEKVQEKWRLRNRSPLKFVESYLEFEDLVSYHERGFDEPDAGRIPERFVSFIRQMRGFLVSLSPDYQSHLGFANIQRKKNEYWRDRFDPPPRPLQGGRADGNR